MRRPRPLLAFLAVSLILGGCAGADEPTETAPVSTGPPPLVPPDADYGGVEGFVYGADFLPKDGALVGLVGTNQSVLSDATGYYALLPIEPGHHRIQVNLSQHFPIVRSLAVGAGQSVRLDFTLVEIPNAEPYVDDSFVRRGQIQCQARVNVTPQNTNTNPSCSDVASQVTGPYLPPSRGANITLGPGALGLLVEVQWRPSTPTVNEKLRLAVRISEIDTWRQFEGASVLRVELGPGLLEDMSRFGERNYTETGGQLFFNLYPGKVANNGVVGAGGTFQQDYVMYVTIFYRQPPIAGFTRVSPS